MKFVTRNVAKHFWLKKTPGEVQRTLDDVIRIVERDPAAKKLLAMARADKFDIRFEEKLIGTQTGALFSQGKKEIWLQPNVYGNTLKNKERAASSLAHELRHYWQYKKMGFNATKRRALHSNPRLSLIFNRILEGDAHAFQRQFDWVLYERKQGRAPTTEQVKIRLREEFAKALGDTEEAISPLYAFNIAYTHSRQYRKITSGKIPKVYPVSTKEMLKAMRGFLKESPDDSMPGYMDGLSDRDLLKIISRHADPHAKKSLRLMERARKAAVQKDLARAEKLIIDVKKHVARIKKRS